MIAVGAKRAKPSRSSDSRVERKEILLDILALWLGIRMKKRKSATMPPAGRFI
jgi:hypothetical protein